jgi:hypothetical protein
MPGFANTPANWEQFWLSFWASLLSGALYSLLVGLMVGFIVWLAQRRSDTRQLRNQWARELATFRARLRDLLNQPVKQEINKISDLPTVWKEIAEVLANLPIDLWHENLSKQQKFIDLVKTFQKAYYACLTEADTLEIEVGRLIRQYTYSEHNPDPLEKVYQSYFLGRLLDEEDVSLLIWIGCSRDALPHIHEVYHQIKADERCHSLEMQYLTSRTQVNEAIEALKKDLN